MKIKLVQTIFVSALSLSLTGCFAAKPPPITHYSQLSGGGAQQTKEYAIPRKKLLAAITQGEEANNIRLVEIFRRDAQTLPQYRMFQIKRGSAYDLLGLQEGDVLFAADDLIIYEPSNFRIYVTQYLPKQKEANVTISRGGVTMINKYVFTDDQ